jgi:hypothetical protein
VGNPKDHSEDQGIDGGWAQTEPWGGWLGECRVDPVGSGQGPVAGCCEYGDEPLGSSAMELVS